MASTLFKHTNFQNSSEIEQFFSQYFHIDDTKISEAENFLKEHGINYSKIHVGDYPILPSVVDFNRLSHINEYDTSIAFRLPNDALKPPSLRQKLNYVLLRDFRTVYRIFFLTKNDTLVQLVVRGDKIAL